VASAHRFGYSAPVRPQTVVFVEPPYVCWDRAMDRVREHGAFVEDREGMNAMQWVFVPRGLASVARWPASRASSVASARTCVSAYAGG
jgi:hypothetical protein